MKKALVLALAFTFGLGVPVWSSGYKKEVA